MESTTFVRREIKRPFPSAASILDLDEEFFVERVVVICFKGNGITMTMCYSFASFFRILSSCL